MRLQGTSVIKFEKFIDNLKELAGTNSITRLNYDNNPNKLCSFSHINKKFNLSWNSILEVAKIKPIRILPIPSTQGRKPKDRSKYKTVECLRCSDMFESPDPKNIRICFACKKLVQLEDIEE